MSKKLNLRKVTSLALVLGLSIPMLYPSEVRALEENKKITILHTNDIHGRFVKNDKTIGVDVLSSIKKQTPNSLLLDAGDTIHGLPFVTLNKGQDAVDLMNAAGYDFMTPGNHDFNYGYERLLELVKKLELTNGQQKMRVLSSNVTKDGKSVFTPNAIKEVNGVKVGIFGLSSPETAYKTNPNNVKGLKFEDPVQMAKKQVEDLEKNGAEVIVGLAHVGIDESSDPTTIDIANEVKGIDVIVDGHSHSNLPNGKKVKDTLIVSTGEYMQNIGKVELEVSSVNGKHEVVNANASHITKEQASKISSDSVVENKIKEIEEAQDKILSVNVGNSDVHLEGRRENVRTKETNLGNLITDAMISETNADVAITNGGGIRDSINRGDITKGEVIKVLPFGNYIVTKELTGAQIKKVLEHGVKDYGTPAGSFTHIGGMKIVVDPRNEVGNKVVDITINNKKIDMNKKYTVATNDFMAVGGDDYPCFNDEPIINEYSGLDEALIKYIEKTGTVSPKVEGRITSVIEKLIGDNRYHTAAKISLSGFEKADNVVLVNPNAMSDALSATPFAKFKDAPVLLTESSKLSNETKAEIQRLGAKNVYIVGGNSVVNENVVNELKAMNLITERISGKDRYETSLKVAKKLGDVSEVAVVNGVRGLSDAVSIAPVAANKNMPILLASDANGSKIFDEFIKDEKITKSYVIGKEASISEEIAKTLPNSQRIGGIDRGETNAMIIDTFYKDIEIKNLFVAKNGINREQDLVDALALGVVASKENSPILIGRDKLNDKQKGVLGNKTIKSLTQVGGNGNEGIVKEVSNMIKR
ncbi:MULTISPECIES: 5'-nucleotidase C-terminal domain-containing protein [Romboutsia]|uniref:5'-nucleotidase C-terminal domain-containing protein n=1 Tax=Romboutsia TaxID=1501226 RepID=UPI000A3ED51E|nr:MULTISPECIES: 5'-nucleotidase C-terminal domain-containing protein [Romboutsia]MDB8801451.1 5'-nucleotidase C-terminal domain-containing protein [Romboutsia sp. 1001216sp1]MDB8812849.1 5'-nucleotidase C-terminal domain-containing protein [Romboutsia sp. 1001216sp1]